LTAASTFEISDFSRLSTDAQINRTALALEANGIHTLIAEDGKQANKLFFELLPEGSQVFQGASITLDTLGITAHIEGSGCFDAIRPQLRSLDRQTQSDKIRSLGASPEYMVGSVSAVMEDGRVLVASATGSQLGPYVSGAKKVIWVVGAQKLVQGLEQGMRRIEEYILPLENERLLKAYGMHTSLNKILIIQKERPGRISMILVKETWAFNAGKETQFKQEMNHESTRLSQPGQTRPGEHAQACPTVTHRCHRQNYKDNHLWNGSAYHEGRCAGGHGWPHPGTRRGWHC